MLGAFISKSKAREEKGEQRTNLSNSNGWSPTFFFIDEGKTNGSGRIDIWVEESRGEFTCGGTNWDELGGTGW